MSGRLRVVATALALQAVSILAADSAAANIVTNGGFETGDFTGWSDPGTNGCVATAAVACAPAGYLLAGDPGPAGGTYAGYLGGPPGYGNTLDQSLTTTAGATYALTFDLGSVGSVEHGSTPNVIVVRWGGLLVYSATDLLPAGYQHLAIGNLAAAGTETRLSFTTEHGPGFFVLDEISVDPVAQPVPEPGSTLLLASGLVGLTLRRRAG